MKLGLVDLLSEIRYTHRIMAERDVYLAGGIPPISQKREIYSLRKAGFTVVGYDELGSAPLSGWENALQEGAQIVVVHLFRDKRIRGRMTGREAVAKLRETEGLIIVSFNSDLTGIPGANKHVRRINGPSEYVDLAKGVSSANTYELIKDLPENKYF